MVADLDKLSEVQVLDQEIQELRRQLASYPRIWEEMKARVAEARAKHEATQSTVKKQVEERKKYETLIRRYTEELKRSEGQRNSIKTSKEYEAINKQCDTIRTKLSQIQEAAIELLDSGEATEKAVEAAGEELKKLEDQARVERERIRSVFNEKKTFLDQAEKERENRFAGVDPDLRKAYERVNTLFPANGIVPVRNHSCGGCNFYLLADVVARVRLGKDMVHCTNCGRLLSHIEGEENAIAG